MCVYDQPGSIIFFFFRSLDINLNQPLKTSASPQSILEDEAKKRLELERSLEAEAARRLEAERRLEKVMELAWERMEELPEDIRFLAHRIKRNKYSKEEFSLY